MGEDQSEHAYDPSLSSDPDPVEPVSGGVPLVSHPHECASSRGFPRRLCGGGRLAAQPAGPRPPALWSLGLFIGLLLLVRSAFKSSKDARPPGHHIARELFRAA